MCVTYCGPSQPTGPGKKVYAPYFPRVAKGDTGAGAEIEPLQYGIIRSVVADIQVDIRPVRLVRVIARDHGQLFGRLGRERVVAARFVSGRKFEAGSVPAQT